MAGSCLERLPVSSPGEGAARACHASARYDAPVQVRDVLAVIEADGWFLVATRGSHRQYRHPTKPGRVTVPGKPADDLAPGTLNSIWKQAGIERRRP
jgi:predicted RNA binding protein YcfA (HicA-like mRNA interferase family)